MKKRILLLLAAIFLILMMVSCTSEETREIKALNLTSNKSISGVFVLGVAGFSSSENAYYYTYIKGSEGYRIQAISAECVELVETDSVTPSIKGIFGESGRIIEFQDYVLYVPVGTIYADYNADLTELGNS